MASETTKKLLPIASALSPADYAFIESRALQILASLEGQTSQRNAEVYPDVTPHWHVVTALPGQERLAAEDLSDRGFGVYLPESEHTEIRRGRKVDLKRLMLPGYVFVFVWDVDRHINRIRACDGVRGMIFINGHVAVVPDRFIDVVRMAENRERPLKGLTASEDQPVKKPKRCWRKTRKAGPTMQSSENEIIGVHCYSPMIEELRSASDEQRLSAFHRALGWSCISLNFAQRGGDLYNL